MKYIALIIGVFLIAVSAFNCMLYKNAKKIKFVDTAYLYNNFKLKQELEATFNDIKTLKQRQLDSLYDAIMALKKSKKQEETMSIEKEYLQNKNRIFEDQENLRVTYDSQIWDQLNTFVKKYGELNNIDLIVGANGEGNVMHGNKDMNISEEVVEFINKQYSGKQN